MDELIRDYNNKVCFIFYEYKKECKITVYNDKNVLEIKNVSEEEGKSILLDYCLFWRTFELIPQIDTICLENSNKTRGFVRYIETSGVIKEKTIDLFYNNSIIKFLCNYIETLQKSFERIGIEAEEEFSVLKARSKLLIAVKNHNLMFFVLDNARYFSYIISRYMKRHQNLSIQYAKEDSNQIVLDGIEFSMELLEEEQRECFTSKIRENNNASFAQFLDSPFGQKLNQSLESQDSMQLVRTKPDMPE